MKLSDVLFVYCGLFTVINNDETIVRSLQLYFTTKLLQADRAMGPLMVDSYGPFSFFGYVATSMGNKHEV